MGRCGDVREVWKVWEVWKVEGVKGWIRWTGHKEMDSGQRWEGQ